MKLGIIERALTAYANSADAANEFEDVIAAIRECAALRECYDDSDTWRDCVQIITQSTLIDFLNMTTYDVFGKRQKESENYVSGNCPQYYIIDCHREVPGCEQLTREQLTAGYDFLTDLWRDNEADGANNPDGTIRR